jgi:two-component system, chemotaxis family, protein-glutamate methylesterase/glutaminase
LPANHHLDILAIGASTGGIEALTGLLKALARNLSATVLLVLHRPPGTPSLAAGNSGTRGRTSLRQIKHG